MPNFPGFCNNSVDSELKSLSEDQDKKPETALAELILDESLKKIEDSPVNHWMEIASPILKSGGKPVAIILALGFISIPLMVTGSPWVALTLAIGASATAVCSCF